MIHLVDALQRAFAQKDMSGRDGQGEAIPLLGHAQRSFGEPDAHHHRRPYGDRVFDHRRRDLEPRSHLL